MTLNITGFVVTFLYSRNMWYNIERYTFIVPRQGYTKIKTIEVEKKEFDCDSKDSKECITINRRKFYVQ